MGARLLWTKGRGLLSAWRDTLGRGSAADPAGAASACGRRAAVPAAYDRHGHDRHDHGDHAHGNGHGAYPAAGHVHDDQDGHSHGPEPESLAGPGGWRRGFLAIVAVGLRPCSGAILVLVFALAQGLFWAGIAATLMMGLGTALTVAAIATFAVAARSLAGRLSRTRSGYGELALRGLEVGAAALVLCFGVLLLTGHMASERLFGV